MKAYQWGAVGVLLFIISNYTIEEFSILLDALAFFCLVSWMVVGITTFIEEWGYRGDEELYR